MMRVWKILAIAALSLAMPAGQALAQAFPNKPIRVIVPYAPGGATDIMGRVVAQRLSEILGQQVLVDNRPGANTGIGAEAVAKAPADGYTLMFTNDATFVLNPALFTTLPYNMARDFVPVATVAYLNLALVVAASLPVNNFAELVAWTKSKSGSISYGSYGVGSQAHLMGEMYKKLYATDIVHVPYKGSAPAVADVIGGQVVFTFPAIPTVQGFIKSGRVKVLAISGDKRSPLLPEVPTIAESGVPGYDGTIWWGVLGPAGIPGAIVTRLNTEIGVILRDPEMGKRLVAEAAEPVIETPEAFGKLIVNDIGKWGRVAKQAGLHAE